MLRRILVAVVLAAFCSSSFAGQKPPPTPIADHLSVEMLLEQQEIQADSSSSAMVGAQFGLIGALISSAVDNAAAKKAQARVAPLRDALVDYPFNERFERAIRSRMPADGISPDPVVTVLTKPWSAADGDRMPRTALVLTPKYALSFNSSRIYVTVQVAYVTREIRKDKIKARIPSWRRYSFEFEIPADKDVDANTAKWVAMPQRALKSMLDEAIDNVADMIVFDYSVEGRAGWSTKARKMKTSFEGRTLAGQEVRRGDGWIWLRGGAHSTNVPGSYALISEGIVGYRAIDPNALPPKYMEANAVGSMPSQAPSIPAPVKESATDAVGGTKASGDVAAPASQGKPA